MSYSLVCFFGFDAIEINLVFRYYICKKPEASMITEWCLVDHVFCETYYFLQWPPLKSRQIDDSTLHQKCEISQVQANEQKGTIYCYEQVQIDFYLKQAVLTLLDPRGGALSLSFSIFFRSRSLTVQDKDVKILDFSKIWKMKNLDPRLLNIILLPQKKVHPDVGSERVKILRWETNYP